jgi:alpha,alpha-trehalase
MPNQDIDKNDLDSALNYVDRMWDNLTRFREEDLGTLIGLPHPYIVPSQDSSSGFAFDEQYYWDSYIIAQGLMKSGRQELAFGMLENLIFMFKRFGIIPNASRYYLSGRSQPPVLTSYIFDIYEYKKDSAWLAHCMAIAEREYFEVWTSIHHPNWRNVFNGLSRFYDVNVINGLAEAESGWDTTTRYDDRCLSFLPVCLNSLLYKYEADLAKFYSMAGDKQTAQVWLDRADNRKKDVSKYMWDESKQFFFDYDYTLQEQSEVWSLAAYHTMWTGLASEEQAEKLVGHLKLFKHSGGLATTKSSRPEDHTLDKRHQWAHPNGWAPLQWIVIKGLENYGYHEEAKEIALTWINTNLDYYLQKGVFREAYNVVEPLDLPEPGLYPPQTGFGWTNSVFIDLVDTYLPDARIRNPAQEQQSGQAETQQQPEPVQTNLS